MLQRIVEAKAISSGEPRAEGRAAASRAQPVADRDRTDRRLIVQQSAPLRHLFRRQRRRRSSRACRYARQRPDRPSDRRGRPRLTSPAGLRPGEHRPGADPADGQPVISQGRGDGTVDLRPLEVGRNPFKPRRHRRSRREPAASIRPSFRSPGSFGWTTTAQSRCPLADPGSSQLRHRRAAVRAGCRRRGSRRPAEAQ